MYVPVKQHSKNNMVAATYTFDRMQLSCDVGSRRIDIVLKNRCPARLAALVDRITGSLNGLILL